MKNVAWATLAVAAMALSPGARADDQPFLTVYTTDIDTQYEKEIEQTFVWSSQKPHQAFNGYLSRTEFEYGVTDDFQLSGYLNYQWERSSAQPSTGTDETWHAVSVSGEAIYRFLNPYFDPIGLAVYFEPTYGDNTRELEAKLLLQKNFFNSDLRVAANLNFENAWEREGERWAKGSAFEVFAGAAYNLTPEWSLGAELNNENDFEGLFGNSRNRTTAWYLGPTISWVATPFVVRLGAEFQLPWASAHNPSPGTISNGFLTDAERLRVGFRISMDLP
jgi:opacity protein-like surface antigen